MKWIITPILILSLIGCSERYRYHCQNPENWEDTACQKPQCEADGDCAEYHIRPIFERTEAPIIESRQGECR
jgi:hypothetical protein